MQGSGRTTTSQQIVLLVFLENGGRAGGVDLPAWASLVLDRASQAYARSAVRLQAWRHYDRIVVLEEEQATAAHFWQALLDLGDATVDVLMLVHGQPGYACGHGEGQVGADFFAALRDLRAAGLASFNLRAVYQMNCYGETLAPEWLSIGAQAVNGAVGVNWLPEPSLSVFLRGWLGGRSFEEAVQEGYRAASGLLGWLWPPQSSHAGRRQPHDRIASSRMVVFGDGTVRARPPGRAASAGRWRWRAR